MPAADGDVLKVSRSRTRLTIVLAMEDVLHWGEPVVGLDTEVHGRLVVLLSGYPTVDGIAIYEQGVPALLGHGAQLPSGEDRMRSVKEDVLELAGPRLVSVVEDLDAPYPVGAYGTAHWLVDFPVGLLALRGLDKRYVDLRNRIHKSDMWLSVRSRHRWRHDSLSSS